MAKETKGYKIITPESFDRALHFYEKVLNAHTNTVVRNFLNMENERILTRYCHLNPQVNYEALKSILSCRPNYFGWSGADLFNCTTAQGVREMIIIEINSCPSGQKSMPILDDPDEHGGYKKLIEETFLARIKEAEEKKLLPEGELAVIYDKNEMEASGYAAAIAELMKEPVHFVEFLDRDTDPSVRFDDGLMKVRTNENVWVPIRGAFRYVTQKPWNRVPIETKTLIFNPISSCLCGGRNKLLAAKAYDMFNQQWSSSGLEILVPETRTDVDLDQIPKVVEEIFGGMACVKNPYSNAGQGVWTITSKKELDNFMEENQDYTKFIVQSLIGHHKWSNLKSGRPGQYYHVGTVPSRRNRHIYVADLRMMVHFSQTAGVFKPLAIYGRRAAQPLNENPEAFPTSWEMLGTNLSYKEGSGGWKTDVKRLLLMDQHDFNILGIGIDDLISAYVQAVMATVAIDNLTTKIMPLQKPFDISLFSQLNNDVNLIKEINDENHYDEVKKVQNKDTKVEGKNQSATK